MSDEIEDDKLHKVTYKDLILFKEEILKELRNYKKKISSNVNVELEKYKDILDKAKENLSFYEKDKSGYMSKLDFVQEKENLFAEFTNKNGDLKNQVMVNQLHLSLCRKDLDNACYKYDKIVSDNLLVPGIVGTSCKFQNLKEYIIFNKEELNNAFVGNRQNANDINLLKKKIDTTSTQINTKVKSMEYRLSNFMTSKYHELDGKFDRLYEELNKRMNTLNHAVESNLEERKSELVKLKNFVLEENNKAIDNVKSIKNDMMKEFDEMKKNFKKIRKNILSLTSLLMGRTHNLNRQFVMNNFNNMMIELFKEFTTLNVNGIEMKNIIKDTKTYRKAAKLEGDSLLKKYIEGKITVDEAKYHIEKKNTNAFMRKKSVQLNDRVIHVLSKDNSKKNFINSHNINENDNINNNIEKINKKFQTKLNNIININNTNIIDKKDEKRNKGQLQIEPINKTFIKKNTTNFINYKRKINKKNEVIDEEDSNKYYSSRTISNSFEEDNKNNEKVKESNNFVTKTSSDNLNHEQSIEKRATFVSRKRNNLNLNKIEEKEEHKKAIIEFSENSSSNSIRLEKSTENLNNQDLNINKDNSENSSKIKETKFKKFALKDFKITNNYIDYSENIDNSNKQNIQKEENKNNNDNLKIKTDNINKEKIEKENKNKKEEDNLNMNVKQQNIAKVKDNKFIENKIFKEIKCIGKERNIKKDEDNKNINNTFQKLEKKVIFKMKEDNKTNTLNINTNNNNYKSDTTYKVLKPDKIVNFFIKKIIRDKPRTNLSSNIRNKFSENIKKEINNFSFLNGLTEGTKINLKKNFDNEKYRNTIIKTDNILFINNNSYNNFSRTQFDGFNSTSNRTVNKPSIYDSPTTAKENIKIYNNTSFNNNNTYNDNIMSFKHQYLLKNNSSKNKEIFSKTVTRNIVLNSEKANSVFSTYENQKNQFKKNKEKNYNTNDIPPIMASAQKKKLKLSIPNIFKDDKDIYLPKETAKNTKYIKDEDIIDKPLILDKNIFRFDQTKGNLENRIMELEYFTKKKLDELVKEIKNFIPIHFNSYIKNYSVEKKKS